MLRKCAAEMRKQAQGSNQRLTASFNTFYVSRSNNTSEIIPYASQCRQRSFHMRANAGRDYSCREQPVQAEVIPYPSQCMQRPFHIRANACRDCSGREQPVQAEFIPYASQCRQKSFHIRANACRDCSGREQ